MSKIIKGTLNVGKTAYSDGKPVVTSVDGVVRDSTTLGFNIDAYTTDQMIAMVTVLPVSNFVPVAGLITYSDYTINFTVQNDALLSGNYLVLPITSIDLNSVVLNPESSTFFVYITMVQGLAKYLISATEITDATTAAYNLLLIGTITTNTTQISAVNISAKSRLDVVSPSAVAAKSSFPVSTGLPSQSGTITW